MTSPQLDSGRPRSVRLTFAFDATGVHLVGRCLRQKPAPRGDDVRAEPRPHAITIELLSRAGGVVYRRTLIDPIPQTVEVFEPDGRPYRLPVARSKGAFTAVVPNLEDATTVVLTAGSGVRLQQAAFASGAEQGTARRELGRFRFTGGDDGRR